MCSNADWRASINDFARTGLRLSARMIYADIVTTTNVINVCSCIENVLDTSVRKTFDFAISRVLPVYQLPFSVLQSFMSSEMARVIISRFRERFTGKTKVVRLQGISDDELYEVTSDEDSLKDRKVAGGEKSKRGKNYEMNETSKRNMSWFAARTDAWKRTLTSGRRQEKTSGEIAISCSLTSSGKKYQKWNTKTGKEIKSDITQSSSSETFDECPSLFMNELAPPTSVDFDGHLSYEQSCDPAVVIEDGRDRGVLTNHVTLNMSAANAWEETRNRTTTKATVMNFFSRFKRLKKSKVMRIRI